jgi:hypothetical protein
MYGSTSIGDTFFLNQSSISVPGILGSFIDMHTSPGTSSIRNLNENVSNVLDIGFSGTGANFGSVGDFISGLDHIVLKSSSTGSYTINSGYINGSNGVIPYSTLQTQNGSTLTFYNTTLSCGDVSSV